MNLHEPPPSIETKKKRVSAKATLEERFKWIGWNEIVRVPELGSCWEWKGSIDRYGYGRLSVGQMKTQVASRSSFIISNGMISEEDRVCHRCDNPPCVNPAHLFIGTVADNMADAVQKNRTAHGVNQRSAKLTELAVIEICERLRSGETQTSIAESFGVYQKTISDIACRKTWIRVTRDLMQP